MIVNSSPDAGWTQDRRRIDVGWTQDDGRTRHTHLIPMLSSHELIFFIHESDPDIPGFLYFYLP